MFSKIVAMISAILLSFLSITSFNTYAVESELFLEKNTSFVNPNKTFKVNLGGQVSDMVMSAILQYIYNQMIINAGINNTIKEINVLYGKERIIGTNQNITDGLVELLYVPLVDENSGGDFVYDCYLNITDCGSYDGLYTYKLSTATKINFGTSGTVVNGSTSPFSFSGSKIIPNMPSTSSAIFLLSGTNNIVTKNISSSYPFPSVDRFLYYDGVYNVNYFTLSLIYSNSDDVNSDIVLSRRQRKVNPFISISENLFKAGQKVESEVYNKYMNNKYDILLNAVNNAKQSYYNTYNEFPEYNSNMTNVSNYYNLNTEYSIDYDSLVPIVPPPESSGGGGVPSDWLGSYPPISTVENFHIDNESVVSYVENVDFQPLSDSFRLFGFVSDFLAEINILPIFLSLLGLGLICWIIF